MALTRDGSLRKNSQCLHALPEYKDNRRKYKEHDFLIYILKEKEKQTEEKR